MDTESLDQKFNEMFAPLLRQWDQEMYSLAAARDKKEGNTLSMIFPSGLRWRFWALPLKTCKHYFCYSTTPNATGHYLSWTERAAGRRHKRGKFMPHNTRREAKEYTFRQFKKAQGKGATS